ncbi:MAG: [Fe-Fe] hydrogenase large subunit C-terminal domain-containing protein [Pyramidobacter sp.]|nr:[Fe-Fe] hydrogenase large subunit C-terminal domain-containing protein [Pyramidobacter sp.]
MTVGLKLKEERCTACGRCVRVCPVGALSLVGGKLSMNASLCIDCGECVRNCEEQVLTLREHDWTALAARGHIGVISDPALYTQIGFRVSPDVVRQRLEQHGVVDLTPWLARGFDLAAYTIVKELQRRPPSSAPMISVYCPAVVRLIQASFPELVDLIVPMENPLEIAAELWRRETQSDMSLCLVAPCSAKVALVKCPEGRCTSNFQHVVSVRAVARSLMGAGGGETPDPDARYLKWGLSGGEIEHVKRFHRRMNPAADQFKMVWTSGMRNVLEILKEVELGHLQGLDYLECRVCDQGCIGGVGMLNPRYLTQIRLSNLDMNWAVLPEYAGQLREWYRANVWTMCETLQPRERPPLSHDIEKALSMMNDLEEVYAQLPHLDCCTCGRPGCRALAEDVVKGRAKVTDCAFKMREQLLHEVEELKGQLHQA